MKMNFCADAQPADSQNHVPCPLEGSTPWAGVELGPAAVGPLTALLPLTWCSPHAVWMVRENAVTGRS